MTIIHRLTDERGKIYEISDGVFRQLLGADDDVVAEGSSVRVPLTMRDGRPQFDSRFLPPTMDQLREVEAARDEYIRWVSSAWQNNAAAPSPAVADSTPRRPTPMPPQPRPPATPVKDDRQAAYDEYCDYLRNAWHREKTT